MNFTVTQLIGKDEDKKDVGIVDLADGIFYMWKANGSDITVEQHSLTDPKVHPAWKSSFPNFNGVPVFALSPSPSSDLFQIEQTYVQTTPVFTLARRFAVSSGSILYTFSIPAASCPVWADSKTSGAVDPITNSLLITTVCGPSIGKTNPTIKLWRVGAGGEEVWAKTVGETEGYEPLVAVNWLTNSIFLAGYLPRIPMQLSVPALARINLLTGDTLQPLTPLKIVPPAGSPTPTYAFFNSIVTDRVDDTVVVSLTDNDLATSYISKYTAAGSEHVWTAATQRDAQPILASGALGIYTCSSQFKDAGPVMLRLYGREDGKMLGEVELVVSGRRNGLCRGLTVRTEEGGERVAVVVGSYVEGETEVLVGMMQRVGG
ncbi:hypothetical protein HK104_005192 [Borealophlyctis nickersoniae]|nr:hypothetical protein HK104_005192 [Borealophlyctis nickersoniae]